MSNQTQTTKKKQTLPASFQKNISLKCFFSLATVLSSFFSHDTNDVKTEALFDEPPW